MDDGSGAEVPIQRVKAVRPTAEELAQYVGEYASEEAESAFNVRLDGEALALTGRPDRRYPLTPLYADAFESEVGTIIFRRAGERATEFSVVEDRVWDLRFRRVPADGAARRILVFGDSNTWGWIPVERGYPTTRYAAGERWPGVAQAALGERLRDRRGSLERPDDGPRGPGRAGVGRRWLRRQRVPARGRRLAPAARPRRHHARHQ